MYFCGQSSHLNSILDIEHHPQLNSRIQRGIGNSNPACVAVIVTWRLSGSSTLRPGDCGLRSSACPNNLELFETLRRDQTYCFK